VIAPAPATAGIGTTAETHRGGCAFCRWLRRDERCRHPDLPARPTWTDARNSEQACGAVGRLWEYAHA
jgi:hypothetical protein